MEMSSIGGNCEQTIKIELKIVTFRHFNSKMMKTVALELLLNS